MGSSAQSHRGAQGGKRGEGRMHAEHGGGSGAAQSCNGSEDGGRGDGVKDEKSVPAASGGDEYEISDSQDYIFLDICSQPIN